MPQKTYAVRRLENMLNLNIRQLQKAGYIRYNKHTNKWILTKIGRKALDKHCERKQIKTIAKRFNIYELVAKQIVKRRKQK